MPTVTIDGAWLADSANGTADTFWWLRGANTTYLLGTDVVSNGTGFVVANTGITIDGQDHSLTYGAATQITMPNPGFESGTGSVPDNWDLSGAPGALRIPAPNAGWWGDWILSVPVAGLSSAVVLSDWVTPTRIGHEHYASFSPHGPSSGMTCLLEVVNDLGAVLASVANHPTLDGKSVPLGFTPANAHPVRLRITFTRTVATAGTIYLDECYIEHCRDYGVIAGTRSSTGTADNVSMRVLPPHLTGVPGFTASNGYKLQQNTTIQNLNFIHGSAGGFEERGVWFDSAKGLTVQDCTFNIGTARNPMAAGGDYVLGAFTFDDNGITTTSQRITSRYNINPIILCSVAKTAPVGGATITIINNRIADAVQMGIRPDTPDESPQTVTITDNIIGMAAKFPNSYGIYSNKLNNFEVARNEITGTGRGISCDATNPTGTGSGYHIHHNTVDVHEPVNLQYGTNSASLALRVRSYPDKILQNILIEDNTFIARGPIGGADNVDTFRLTMEDARAKNVVIRNNTFRAVQYKTGASYNARAFALANMEPSPGTSAQDRFWAYGNRFESNDISLAFGCEDGSKCLNSLLENNELVQVTDEGDTSRPWYPVVVGFYKWTQGPDLHLCDTPWPDGHDESSIIFAGDNFSVANPGTKELFIDHRVTVNVSGTDGAVVPGAAVTIKDADDATVASGTAGSTGQVADLLVSAKRLYSLAAAPKTVLTETLGPHTLAITADGYDPYEAPLDITGAAGPVVVNANLAGEEPPPPPEEADVTEYTLDGPTAGTVGIWSAPYTVRLGGGTLADPVTITPSGAFGDLLDPATVILTDSDRSGTFRRKPAAEGVHSVSTANSGTLDDPPAISVTDAAGSDEKWIILVLPGGNVLTFQVV